MDEDDDDLMANLDEDGNPMPKAEDKVVDKLTIPSIIERLGAAAQANKPGMALAIREDLMLRDGMATLCVPADQLRGTINGSLGYLCGYLPVEYANIALTMLDVEHPVFGRQISASADEAFEAGRRLAEDYTARKRKLEAQARKAAKAAEGLDIPEPDEVVTSEAAKALLEAMRAKRTSAKGGPAITVPKFTAKDLKDLMGSLHAATEHDAKLKALEEAKAEDEAIKVKNEEAIESLAAFTKAVKDHAGFDF